MQGQTLCLIHCKRGPITETNARRNNKYTFIDGGMEYIHKNTLEYYKVNPCHVTINDLRCENKILGPVGLSMVWVMCMPQ